MTRSTAGPGSASTNASTSAPTTASSDARAAPPRRLVLVGGGHSHAQVLEDWIARPVAGVELTVVSPDARSPYSGMVPGWLAGLYDYDTICIDVAGLCAAAGATFVQGTMTGLDPVVRRIHLRGGASIGYDVLSLDVGSTLQPPDLDGATVLPLRPLSRLRSRWDALLADLADDRSGTPVSIVGIGGGAAGFEATVALHRQLTRRTRDSRDTHINDVEGDAGDEASGAPDDAPPYRSVTATLRTTADTLLPGLARGAIRRATRVLAARGIALQVGCDVLATGSPATDGTRRIVLWATGARPHSWQAGTPLATDEAGYFRVDRALRSTSHPDVFASGDCAAWKLPLPKAGVYAVRMGPVLAHNLRAALGDGRLRRYRPQRRHLVLLSTADGRAIASLGTFSLAGRWIWRWKDRIDRRFVDRFRAPRLSRLSRPTPPGAYASSPASSPASISASIPASVSPSIPTKEFR